MKPKRRSVFMLSVWKKISGLLDVRELFQLPEWGAHLTFKGGTSLAKAWKLIERFSEDIDIVIERDFLGFGGDRGPEHAPSKKQQRLRLDALKIECRQRIQHSLKPALAARFKSLLPTDAVWRLEEDPTDPDGQSLLFFYPAVIETAAYVQPVVKIELGARSDTEPSETPQIQSYLADAFPKILDPDAFSVRAVLRAALLGKSMLVHEENFRPADKPRKVRLARHYYDLWCLINKSVALKRWLTRACSNVSPLTVKFSSVGHGWITALSVRFAPAHSIGRPTSCLASRLPNHAGRNVFRRRAEV